LTLNKGYGIQCDAIGNILGSTLGTCGRSWKCSANIIGTSESKKFQSCPLHYPLPWWGYTFMYSMTQIEAISHTLHQSPKLRPLLGRCHFLKRTVNTFS
jgi:hypothetical protein